MNKRLLKLKEEITSNCEERFFSVPDELYPEKFWHYGLRRVGSAVQILGTPNEVAPDSFFTLAVEYKRIGFYANDKIYLNNGYLSGIPKEDIPDGIINLSKALEEENRRLPDAVFPDFYKNLSRYVLSDSDIARCRVIAKRILLGERPSLISEHFNMHFDWITLPDYMKYLCGMLTEEKLCQIAKHSMSANQDTLASYKGMNEEIDNMLANPDKTVTHQEQDLMAAIKNLEQKGAANVMLFVNIDNDCVTASVSISKLKDLIIYGYRYAGELDLPYFTNISRMKKITLDNISSVFYRNKNIWENSETQTKSSELEEREDIE